jgi:sphinganine-1-phosphate aldolase
MATVKAIIKGINEIPELKVCGDPKGPVVAFTTVGKMDIYQVGDAMHNAGWSLNTLQNPKSLHICVTSQHIGMENIFIKDLKNGISEIVNHPEKFEKGMAPVYGLAVSLPDKTIVTELISDVVDLMLDVK